MAQRCWRLALAAVAAVAGAAGPAGCAAGPPPTSDPTGPPPAASFSASIEVVPGGGPTRLRIRYQLTNQGATPVVALDGVPPLRSAGTEPEPDGVYVIAREDDTVEISRRAFDRPADVEAAVEPTVLGSMVRPGEDLRDEFEIPLPTELRYPWPAAERFRQLPDPVRSAVFCLGVLPGERMTVSGRPAGPGRQAYPHATWVSQAQHVLCGPVVMVR